MAKKKSNDRKYALSCCFNLRSSCTWLSPLWNNQRFSGGDGLDIKVNKSNAIVTIPEKPWKTHDHPVSRGIPVSSSIQNFNEFHKPLLGMVQMMQMAWNLFAAFMGMNHRDVNIRYSHPGVDRIWNVPHVLNKMWMSMQKVKKYTF